MRIRTMAATAIVSAAVVAVAGTPAMAATATTAHVYVLHAVPATPVDVYVNDQRQLDDFQPSSLAGPLSLPAGTYKVAVVAANAADASQPVIGPVNVAVEANRSYTIAAHLNPEGNPTATAFQNDISATAAGQGRLTVRHTAAAPAVDVLVGGQAVVSNLSNPNEKVLNLPAGTINASVAATGTTTPVIGPADINVREGVNTIVYAWGSLQQNNLMLATQTIEGLHSAPNGVNSGEAGLLDSGNDAGAVGGAIALGLMLVAAAALVVVRRRNAV